MDSQRNNMPHLGDMGRSTSNLGGNNNPLAGGSSTHLGAQAGATQLTMPVSQFNTQQTTTGGSTWIDSSVWGALISTDTHSSSKCPRDLRHRMKDNPVTLGRNSGLSIRFQDERVSGTHCQIFPGPNFNPAGSFGTPSRDAKDSAQHPHDGPYVQDRSLNGTFVNGIRVKKGRTMRIMSGDEISIVQMKNKRTMDEEEQTEDMKEFLITLIFQDYTAPRPAPSSFLQQGGLGTLNNSSLMRSPSSLVGGGAGGIGAYAGSDSQQPLFPSQHGVPDSLNVSGASGGVGGAKKEPKELPHIDWQWGNLIGRGAASDVYVGIDISNGQMIAIKRLHKTKEQQKELQKRRKQQHQNKESESVSPQSLPMNASLCLSTIGGNNNTLGGGAMGLNEIRDRTSSMMFDSMVLTGQSFGLPATAGKEPSSSFIAADLEEEDGEDTPTLAKRNSSANAKGWVVTADVEAELKLLQSLTNRRIVKYLGFAVDESDHVCILLEYVSGGSLQSLITNFGSFLEPIVRIYALQILQGLEFLHSNHVVHGDIKPANILLNDRGHVKLSDFGTSQIVASTKGKTNLAGGDSQRGDSQPEGGPSVELTGTPLWMSPEMIRRQVATFQSDIWAFGCTLLEMATGAQPWSECSFNSPIAAVFHIAQTTTGPSLDKLREIGASDEMISFLQATLTINACDRPSALDLLSHPFILGGGMSSPTAPTASTRVTSGGGGSGDAENAVSMLGQPQGGQTTNPLIEGGSPTNTVVPPPSADCHRPEAAQEEKDVSEEGEDVRRRHKPVLAEHIEYVRSVSNQALNPNGAAVGGAPVSVPHGTTAGGLALGGLSSGLTTKMRGL